MIENNKIKPDNEINENLFSDNLGRYTPLGSTLKFDWNILK